MDCHAVIQCADSAGIRQEVDRKPAGSRQEVDRDLMECAERQAGYTPESDMIKGIGIDTIELQRIARVYACYGQRFLEKIYTEGERDYFLRWSDPVPRIAGRFAVNTGRFARNDRRPR